MHLQLDMFGLHTRLHRRLAKIRFPDSTVTLLQLNSEQPMAFIPAAEDEKYDSTNSGDLEQIENMSFSYPGTRML